MISKKLYYLWVCYSDYMGARHNGWMEWNGWMGLGKREGSEGFGFKRPAFWPRLRKTM